MFHGATDVGQEARAPAATRRSLTRPANAPSRSWARSTADGWIVAIANADELVSSTLSNCSASAADAGHGMRTPRDFVTRNDGPNNAFAAVAPRATTTSGSRRANSATSHGRQAPISCVSGVAWMRRLPVGEGVNLKCLTAFVV